MIKTVTSMAPEGNSGIAIFMVYVADAVSLSVIPSLKALALIVVVELTEMGSEYTVEEDVGSLVELCYRKPEQ